jgi:hypothetical protein
MWCAMQLLDEARSSLERGRDDEALALLQLAVERAAAEGDAAPLEEIYGLTHERAGDGDDWRRLMERAEQHHVELTGRVPAILPDPAGEAPPVARPRRSPLASGWPQLVGLLVGLVAIVYVAVVVGSLAE